MAPETVSYTPPSAASIALAKAIHYANSAAAQFDIVVIESNATHGAKAFLNEQARLCRKAWQNCNLRLKSNETKAVLKSEIQDEFWLDSMLSALMMLNAEGRERIEAQLNELLTVQSLRS